MKFRVSDQSARHPTRLTTAWTQLGLIAIAILAYLPPLLTHRGRVAADTKSYLYLDPARMLGRAAAMWDANIGFGTVTHQNIGYLFPMGPYYWLMDQIGSPDWVAQRIWLGTLVAGAGYGMVYLCRTLHIRGPGVPVAILAFMFSPYSLHYAARISVLLGPWAALPWMIALVVKASRDPHGWRYPAIFAIVVQLVGGVNATALLFAGLGPALWLVWSWLGARDSTLSEVLSVTWRIGTATVLASAWWIAGLSLQSGYGLDILQYTETIKAVARTSSPHEVMRGLGYWFFYGRDRIGPWIEAATNYTQRPRIIVTGYAIASLSLLSLATVRWKYRGYFVLLAVTGVVIAVGAHPYDTPTPLGALFKDFANSSSAGLALRSTGRADPLVILGFAMLLGVGVTTATRWLQRHIRWNRFAFVVSPVVIVLVLSNFPALYDGTYYGSNLEREETIPQRYNDLARYLDATDRGARVLELPGADFASYTFGNTVDPVTPGLSDKPYVARELIPFGSAPSADLLNAFDRRLQEGTASPEGFIEILQRAGIDTVVVRNDIQWERYNLVRPRELSRFLGEVQGLRVDRTFGDLILDNNVLGITDERTLNPESLGVARPRSIVVFKVPGTSAIVRTQSADAPVIVDGDGEGLVDAADSGALSGGGTVLYSAPFEQRPEALKSVAGDRAVLVLTDQNRRRARRWSTVLDNTGYTERAGEQPLRVDVGDNRLPVFPVATDDARTVTELVGAERVQATAYGNPISLTPEDRPIFAFDGDRETRWSVGAFDKVVGQRIEIDANDTISTDRIRLLQIINGPRDRYITSVQLRFDGGRPISVPLGPQSRDERGDGQVVQFPNRSFKSMTVEITGTNREDGPLYGGMSAVGFQEIEVADTATPDSPIRVKEITRLPNDMLKAFGSESLEHPLVVTLTRARVREVPPRSDEETSMVRSFELPTDRRFMLAGDARVFPYAIDPREIDKVLGATGDVQAWANQFLPGCLACRGAAAFDGDSNTAWTTPVNAVLDQWLKVQSPIPVKLDHFDLELIADPRHSLPTEVLVEVGGESARVPVPPITSGTKIGTRKKVRIKFPAMTGTLVKFTITKIEKKTTKSYYAGDALLDLPVSVAEVDAGGLRVSAYPEQIPSPCRRDLVTVNGEAIGIRIVGTQTRALATDPLSVSLCETNAIQLRQGRNLIEVVPGSSVAVQLDRLVLSSAPGGGAAPVADVIPQRPSPPKVVVSEGRTKFTVSVSAANEPFWLVLGQSNNEGWRASINGRGSLGGSTLVEGFANGWRIDPAGKPNFTVTVEWEPQRRVWIAGAISMVSILACVIIVIVTGVRSRARTRQARALPEAAGAVRIDVLEDSQWAWQGSRVSLPPLRAAGLAVLIGAVTGFVSSIPMGLGIMIAVLVANRWPLTRSLFGVGGAALLGVIGLYIAQAQYRHAYPAVFEWPTLSDNMIVPAWISLLVPCAMVVLDAATNRRRRAADPKIDPLQNSIRDEKGEDRD